MVLAKLAGSFFSRAGGVGALGSAPLGAGLESCRALAGQAALGLSETSHPALRSDQSPAVVVAPHLTSFSSVHKSHTAFPAPGCWKNSSAFPHCFPFVLLLNLF